MFSVFLSDVRDKLENKKFDKFAKIWEEEYLASENIGGKEIRGKSYCFRFWLGLHPERKFVARFLAWTRARKRVTSLSTGLIEFMHLGGSSRRIVAVFSSLQA